MKKFIQVFVSGKIQHLAFFLSDANIQAIKEIISVNRFPAICLRSQEEGNGGLNQLPFFTLF